MIPILMNERKKGSWIFCVYGKDLNEKRLKREIQMQVVQLCCWRPSSVVERLLLNFLRKRDGGSDNVDDDDDDNDGRGGGDIDDDDYTTADFILSLVCHDRCDVFGIIIMRNTS